MSSEKAVENFYNWEVTGRGYLLFPHPVKLEPHFQYYYHSSHDNTGYVDDGRVPRFWEWIFPKKKPVVEEPEEEELDQRYEYSPFLKQISVSFPVNFDFDKSETIEFLHMLSESEDRISFEIIGQYDSIEIQIVCSVDDYQRTLNLLYAYYPNAIIKTNIKPFHFDTEKKVSLVDFGYNEEFMRPINSSSDSLLGIMATLENLRDGDIVMFQVIFKGVEKPWANSILRSVSIGKDSFFPNSPEMIPCAKEKVSTPLFSVAMRLAVQSANPKDGENLVTELILNIQSASRSEFNSLIALNNNEYDNKEHLGNLKIRGTNRYGMIMNSQELSSFIHFPSSSKLISSESKTKKAPDVVIDNDYVIGVNNHLGVEKKVSLNDEQRLRHTHIIGATGVGKSVLISNFFLEDVKKGNGCVIFDPHGDTVDEIIDRIPEERLNDVILIDPSDSEYSIGFNLLSAKTEIERIVLSSDLVDGFRRHSTSWGDQMTSVLSNAINAFLYSSKGGTLFELKRFLLEPLYRKEFLKLVDDKSIHYYWNNEFVLLKKVSISPLLTRLDTFLRPKIVRYILSQKEGLDFNEVVSNRKILLVKLSQGLIGEENSYLLGTLILSKIYQVAQARQLISKEERHPFYIYLDEFQNFLSPSINAILSGTRKYGVGLTLAHQELDQIKDTDIGNSVLSNANIRICFRLGDFDAKRLESGFSGFDNNDLQNLNIGQAIVRVGKNTNDFSLNTYPLKEVEKNDNYEIVINNTRVKYSKEIEEIETELDSLISDNIKTKETDQDTTSTSPTKIGFKQTPKTETKEEKSTSNIEEKGKEYLKTFEEKEQIKEHRYLQTFIKKIAEQRGFKASIEEIVENGRVDVSLIKDDIKIACEIAVSNSSDYEVKNIQKCLSAGYSFVCVISKDEKHLGKIKEKAQKEIKEKSNIHFFNPNQMTEFLDTFMKDEKQEVRKIKGYRVQVNYIVQSSYVKDQNWSP